MKKYILLFCYFLSFSEIIKSEQTMLDEKGYPCPALLTLLSITNVDHNGTLESIVQGTQKAWLRKPGSERWEMELHDWAEGKSKIQDALKDLNLIDEIQPQKNKYDYLLLMGCAYPLIESRLEHAIDLYKNNVHYKSVVILSGARPLTESEKQKIQKNYTIDSDKLPQTEAQAMVFLYQNMNMPKRMRKLHLEIIDVPMKIDRDGKAVRPTTGDTLDSWMDKKPRPGTCLVISSQPYTQYQDSVVKTLLPKEFKIESVGAAGNPNIDVHLDNLARFLYQENKRRQQD